MQLPIHEELVAAFQARDTARLARLYAEDAVFTVPGRPGVEGRAAIERMLADDFQDPGFSLGLHEVRTLVSPGGDFACTRGQFQLAFTDPQSGQGHSLGGTYIQVYRKRADGGWEVVEDISTPGPASSSAG
jgi:uncharacterized protein (TIGR02246 family)